MMQSISANKNAGFVVVNQYNVAVAMNTGSDKLLRAIKTILNITTI